MTSNDDITEVIGNYVKTYIKPTYPIYRIRYCLSCCCWDAETMESRFYSYLVECKSGELIDNLLYSTNNPSINKEFVAQWNQLVKDGRPFFKIDDIESSRLPKHTLFPFTGDVEISCEVIIIGLERIV